MSLNNIKATDFIRKKLQEEFILLFPQTRVRYEFDVLADVHCLEVMPNKIHRSNEDYINWENDFTDNFIALFPDQGVYFFSDDSIVGIENILFEIRGKNILRGEKRRKYSACWNTKSIDKM